MPAPSIPAVRRAVAYFRCSTTKQERSIPEQREWCRTAAAREGLDVLAEFADDGVSGSEVERRPGLMKMVAFCEKQPRARRVEVILCWDNDRLSRASSTRTAAVLDDLMAVGVTRLFTSEGWVDLEDEGDLLIFNVRQDMGRSAFSRSIAKNVARNALDRAGKGLWVAGKPPYGYALGADGRLAIAEPAASAVRRLFARLLAGDSLGDLARALNADGTPPPGKGLKRREGFVAKWRRDAVCRILRNRNYVGDLVWNRRHSGKYQRIRAGRPEKTTGQRGADVCETNAVEDVIVIEGAHPAIIDRQTFEAAGARLTAARWKRTAPTTAGEWVFSGLVRCGDCGSKMYGQTQNRTLATGLRTYRRYICSRTTSYGKGACRTNRIQQEAILAAVLEEVSAIYADPGRLARLTNVLADKASQAEASGAVSLQRLEAQLAELNAKIAKAEENMAFAPAHQVTVFSRVLDGLNRKRDELSASREAMSASAAEAADCLAGVSGAIEALARLGQDVLDVPPREARRVVERLVTKVTVVFDHSRPANVCQASHVDIEFHPDIAKMLPPRPRRRPL